MSRCEITRVDQAGSGTAGCVPGGYVARVVATLLLSGLLLTVGALTRASSATAAEPGVNVSNPSAPQTADIKTLGTHWVRMFVSWRAVQPTPAAIAPSALASYEQMFTALPPGTKVILDVVGTPQWETGSPNEHAPPANPEDYAAFVGALAERFGTRVSADEIWNEEDAPGWWAGGPDPAAYARLLKATHPVVKDADPSATVVLGGLTGNDYAFLEGVYKAGAKGSFDAVGVHTDTACNVLSPYEFLRTAEGRMIPDSFLAYREVHAVMLANGDEEPIWMTELSWRTTDAICSEGAWAGQKAGGVSDEQQATYLRQAYHCLAQDPYVQVALWFALQDEGVVTSGLLRANGSRKPSFAAMESYARAGDTLSEPCGVLTGPKLTVLSPVDRASYSGSLPIDVMATSSQGVYRIKLEYDGKLIRNYGGSSFPTSLFGALDWQHAKHIPYGWHTLTFLAYDRENNVSQTSIVVYHADPASANNARARSRLVRRTGRRIVRKPRRKRVRRRRGRHH